MFVSTFPCRIDYDNLISFFPEMKKLFFAYLYIWIIHISAKFGNVFIRTYIMHQTYIMHTSHP